MEGLALVPTDFGQLDASVWKHKAYAGSLGTHGCRYAGQSNATQILDTGSGARHLTMVNMNASNFSTSDLPPSL